MTNDFFKRWRQHNKEIKGGAKYTSKREEWYPICIIDGFETMKEAMQCEWAVKHKKKVIIGTTGFQKKHWDAIKKASKKIAILQSGNMSLGINLMQFVSQILSKGFFNDYQMEVHDDHHIKKIDYPSGTALMLGHAVANGKGKKLSQIQGKIFLNKKGKGIKNKLNFYIIRKGKTPGTHSVIFENKQEKIEIQHTAHSRDLFAEGAINAAKWLKNKKPGLYNMHHVLGIK